MTVVVVVVVVREGEGGRLEGPRGGRVGVAPQGLSTGAHSLSQGGNTRVGLRGNIHALYAW